MGRFVLAVLDGLGIGAMEDVPQTRPEDAGACTLGSVLGACPDLRLPNLESLGIMNALGRESSRMRFSPRAVWGRSALMHWGADTFWGHQEIMGALPGRPRDEPFSSAAPKMEKLLRAEGYRVERIERNAGENVLLMLKVEGSVIVGDNLEADPGQNYNVVADLNKTDLGKALEIGRVLRANTEVGRVICFGNPSVGMAQFMDFVEEKDGRLLGVSSARSGVYGEGYRSVHLGRGADPGSQVPALLAERDVPVFLFGKAADIVENPKGKSVSAVGAEEAFSMTLEALDALERGFICVNAQGADLAGHMRDPGRCAAALEEADLWIGRLTERLKGDDVLVVLADHGNDPCIGHSRHTREKVPVLVRSPALADCAGLGERRTLSDAAAAAAAYFGARPPENPHARPLFESSGGRLLIKI